MTMDSPEQPYLSGFVEGDDVPADGGYDDSEAGGIDDGVLANDDAEGAGDTDSFDAEDAAAAAELAADPEYVDDPEGALVHGVLARVDRAAAELTTNDREVAAVARRIEELQLRLAGLVEGTYEADDHMHGVLVEGRTRLWEAMPKEQVGDRAYATGGERLARAAVLSPEQYPEPAALRDMRVSLVETASQHVVAGRPTVISDRYRGKMIYVGGVPTHDGLSVSLEDTHPTDPRFKVGINDKTDIDLNEVWQVRPVSDKPNAPVEPAVHIRVGEENIQLFLADECAGYMKEINGIEERMAENRPRPRSDQAREALAGLKYGRNMAREGLVGAITAAHDAGIELPLGADQQQAVRMLRDHLFDQGDTNQYRRADLLAAGRAMQAVYPPDAELEMGDYLINSSQERRIAFRQSEAPRPRHHQLAIMDVLQTVCKLTYYEAFRVYSTPLQQAS